MNNQDVDDHNLLLISQLYPNVYIPLVPQQGLPILKSQSFYLRFLFFFFKETQNWLYNYLQVGLLLFFSSLFLIINLSFLKSFSHTCMIL